MNKLDSQRLYLTEIIDKSRSRIRAKYSEDRIAKVIEKIVSADNIDSICVDIAESIVEIVNKRIESDEAMKTFRSDVMDSSVATLSSLDMNNYSITASPISRSIDLENTPENRAQIDRIIEYYLSRREMA